MEQPLLDHQAAGDDLLADVFSQAVDGAISLPGDIGKKFERMSADGVAEEFFFSTQPLQAAWLRQWN